MLRHEAAPPPASEAQVFTLKHSAGTCLDFCCALDSHGPWGSVEGCLPLVCPAQGFSFCAKEFYSWIICRRLRPGVFTLLFRFSSLNGPVLCCHPGALPPLQPSAAGRKCLLKQLFFLFLIVS